MTGTYLLITFGSLLFFLHTIEGGNDNGIKKSVINSRSFDDSNPIEERDLQLQLRSQVCGGTYTSETGILLSQNYPNQYNNNAFCVWNINVADWDTITLTFTNMDLEYHADCVYDYVEVRDGPNVAAALMGRFCGDSMPTPMITTGNTMYVEFSSDFSVTKPGFRAIWDVAGGQCGGNYNYESGILFSPYYPDHYTDDTSCIWNITVADWTAITLTFTSMDLEYYADCRFDYVEVRDGPDATAALMGRFCGDSMPPPMKTTGNTMYVEFGSDFSVTRPGFRATWEVDGCIYDAFECASDGLCINWDNYCDDSSDCADGSDEIDCGCGYRKDYAVPGAFRTPFFTGNNLDCLYEINGDGRMMRLEFNHYFEVGFGTAPNCSSVFVEVFNADGASQGKFCGYKEDVRDVSFLSTAFSVKYKIDDSPGWHLGFEIVFGCKYLTFKCFIKFGAPQINNRLRYE